MGRAIFRRRSSQGARCFRSRSPRFFPTPMNSNREPMVKATGFREYDARWLFGKEINLMGVQALGMGLGTLIREMGVAPEIVTAHDFRSYSASIKYALVSGLMAAGCKVHDIGLALTPMAYFAQFDLDVPVRRHGDGLAQRQWLDRRENGREPPAHLRSRRDDAAEGDRARRQVRSRRRRRLCLRREFSRALHRRSHQPAEAQAQAQGRRRLRQRHRRRLRAARVCRRSAAR